MVTNIVDFNDASDAILEQAAILLVDHFDLPRGWPDLPSAREELAEIRRDGFARGLVEGDTLLGWIGGRPEYHGRVWELHPLVVHRDARRRASDASSWASSKRRRPGGAR